MASRADRQVDAGGQDDQGLTDGQGGDHRGLLQDDGDRRGLSEPRVDDGEGNACHDQHHQRAERGMAVQQMLDALERRLLSQRKLFRRGRWCLWFD